MEGYECGTVQDWRIVYSSYVSDVVHAGVEV